MNIREYVEIYKQGDFLGIGAAGEGLKIRLLIGHKVVGIDFYVYEKYGAYVIPLTGSSAREAYEQLYMYAERTFAMLRAQPFWRKECKLYGYHFGQDYEIDGQGEILGEWPQVGVMWINCEKIFPLKFSGGRLELPEEFAHLKLFRMPEITGKAIEVDRSKERLKIAGDNEIFLGWTE